MRLPNNLNDWPELWRERYEERAGIMEYMADMTRREAERQAEKDIRFQADVTATNEEGAA